MTTSDRLYNLASIYEATIVPLDRTTRPLVLTSLSADLLEGDTEELEGVVERVFGRHAGPLITFQRFTAILGQIEQRDVWRYVRDYVAPWHWPPFHKSLEMWEMWEKSVNRIQRGLAQLREPQQFAFSALLSIVNPVTGHIPVFLRPAPPLPPWVLFPTRLAVLEALYWWGVEERRLEIEVEEFSTWIAAAEVLTRPVPPRVEETLRGMMQYDVPYSLSPKISGQSIDELFRQARNFVYLPLAGTAWVAGQAAMQGEWVLALQVALGGGGTVVILAAAVSLAEFLMDLPHRKGRKRR